MKEIRFVDVGEGITEGHIKKWLVADGADVKEDQSLLQVETDKAVVNVPSPIDGSVKIVAKENTIVKVGELIAQVGTKQELGAAKVDSKPVEQASAAASQRPEHEQVAEEILGTSSPAAQPIKNREIMATPYVRKLANDLKVDIATITGTGPNGRILENDVRGHVSTTTPVKVAPKYSEVLEEQHQDDIERIPLSMTRKAIAKNMEASLSVPSAVHIDLINATNLYNSVMKWKGRAEKEAGVKLTFLPFVMKAVVQAIKENPNFNASYDHEKLEIIRKNYYNIGIAAEAPDGLKVIVVKYVDKKSIFTIAKELQNMGEKVKNQTITMDEMKDNTFTITNIGSLGGGYLSVPIINYPDVAILGIHLIREEAIVVESQVRVGRILPFSLVFDHRVVDGADAVKFGNSLKKYLEDPDFLEMM